MANKRYATDVWYQVDGDVDAAKHGATIARFSESGSVELVEIQPVREYVGDREAAEVGYPFWSREAYFDSGDLPSGSHARKLGHIMEVLYDGGEWEEGNSGWAADVLPVPGAQASKIKWYVPQGHGFREEEAMFRQEILGQ